jgi:leader peptidase (prepilin peptidase)/N-methyltransferase
VELLTGLVFATIFWKFQNLFYMDVLDFILTFKYYAIMFSLLIVIAVYDLKHKIIPDVLSFVFGLLAFLGMFFFSNFNLNVHVPSLLEFLSGMIVAGPFAFFWLVSRGRWMGLGDAKLALGIGWLLGVPFALSGLALSFWFGAIIGVALILVSRSSKEGRLGMKSEIPFAPFLVLGTFLAFVCELNIFGF